MPDEPINDAPAAGGDAGAVSSPSEPVVSPSEPVQPSEPTTPADGTSTDPVDANAATTPNDEYADLYDKLDDEIVDPNAPPADNAQQPVDNAQFKPDSYPEQVRAALGNNPYIDSSETLAQAVEASSIVWDVQTGKADAFESMVAPVANYNPERYNSIIKELARGITKVTGMALVKLDDKGNMVGRFDDAPVDPRMEQMQREFSEYKKQNEERALGEKNAAEQRVLEGVVKSINDKFSSLATGSIIENVPIASELVLQQMDKNGVDPKLARTDMDAYLKQYEKAFKQVKNTFIDWTKQVNKNINGHRQRIRASTPAAPGSGAGAVKQYTPNGEQPQRSQFPEGEEGTRAWQSALYDYTFGK